MLHVWNAIEFVFLSDECVGFKVSTPIYKGAVIITWQDNTFFTVQFRDMELKIMGIPNAEEVLDASRIISRTERCGCRAMPVGGASQRQ